MFLRKIIKTVATRCQILRLQCTKFDFGAGGSYSAPPDLLAGFKGPTSKGREGKGGKGRGREGPNYKGREVKGGEGRGKREREGPPGYYGPLNLGVLE